MKKIRLGISSCLLGENVRYNGGHKLDRFLRDTLGRYAEYVPVCPEVECGLSIPREAMRLVGDPDGSKAPYPQHTCGPYGQDEEMDGETAARAGKGRPEGIYLQEPLAQFRYDRREGIR